MDYQEGKAKQVSLNVQYSIQNPARLCSPQVVTAGMKATDNPINSACVCYPVVFISTEDVTQYCPSLLSPIPDVLAMSK